jgi:hypothetical protein
MVAVVTEGWTTELDRAVDHLRDLAMDCSLDDPARRQIEAASDRLASYALAARSLAEAGVSAERIAAFIERGWRHAVVATALRPRR